MRHLFTRWGPVVAVAATLIGCGDAPEPAGPTIPIQAAAAATQDRLARWFEQSSPVVLALAGTVFADHDEATGRLAFGVEHATVIPGVRNALARLGIPSSAYVVEVTEPIQALATLRQQWRPTQGGIQIHFGNFLCTLGFNADDGSERSFITNSHCTHRQGGLRGRVTEYFQPTSAVDPTVIAVEVEDPEYFRGGVCPRGRKCRYSDAARALYSSGVSSTRGAIAKTEGPNGGSIEVTGAFTITSQDNATTEFPIGMTVNKVGRTTGWTQGNVIATCVHTNIFASNITQLCQTLVAHPDGLVLVGGGDSGSSVFTITGGDDGQLVGILWGGNSSGTMFVFSPLKQVQDELGPLVATQ